MRHRYTNCNVGTRGLPYICEGRHTNPPVTARCNPARTVLLECSTSGEEASDESRSHSLDSVPGVRKDVNGVVQNREGV